MGRQKARREDHSSPTRDGVKAGTNAAADSRTENSKKTEEDKKEQRASVKWAKLILAVAGAIVTIGGAVTVVSQTTHWLDGVTGTKPVTPPSPLDEIEVSPVLGISFHQNGQPDSMSYVNYGGVKPVVTVHMTHTPFEIWFPNLGSDSSLQVCTATGNWIFTNAVQVDQLQDKSCMDWADSAADYPYGGGGLVLSVPGNVGNTGIGGNRAQPAGDGHEKYYVSDLTTVHGQIYLAIYLDANGYGSMGTNGPITNNFQSDDVEDFILSFDS